MEKLLTPAQLCEALSISERRYHRLIADGMPCLRVGDAPGAHRRYDLEKVIAWLEDRTESQNREKLLTPKKLRDVLSISERGYHRLIADGMPCLRVGDAPGAHRRYDLEKVLAWLEDRTESQNREDAT